MLRTHLPEPRYLLTAALPVNPRSLENINLSAAGYVLDYLNLRAYDNTGPWSSAVGHPAQLLPSPFNSAATLEPQLSCRLGVDYLVSRGFPRHKIVVGISTFARCFPGAAGLGCSFVKDKCTDLKYCELPDKWIVNAAIDEEVGAASFVDGREGSPVFLSFDVPFTVRQKAAYVKSMGLAGLFYWSELGDLHGPKSLVVAGQKGLDEL